MLFKDGTVRIQGYKSLGLSGAEKMTGVNSIRAAGTSVLMKLDDGTFVDAPVNDLGWEIHPEGLVECARDLHQRFGGPVWITENGTCDLGDPGPSGHG